MTGPGAGPAAPLPRWHASPSALSALFGGTTLVLLGLVTGRTDVAALGAPLMLSVVWSLAHAPSRGTDIALGDAAYLPSETRIDAVLALEPAGGVATTRLRVLTPGHRDLDAVVDARAPRRIRLSMVTAHTGRHVAFEVRHQDASVGGLHRSQPAVTRPVTVLVLPHGEPLGALPVPERLTGLTGGHRSTRPGDGGDLRDIATFAPGDRLRRIDWRSTARHATGGRGTSELYVRRTFATAEAQVMVVLDSRDAVGPDVATWESGEVHPHDATSLDVARRAAAALARRYIEQGDRVGLVDLGRHRRPLRPAGGRRHLDRILHHLALAEPDGQPTAHVRAPQIPSGALVVVLSTFLDDEAADLARTWRHAGHRTIAIDVLPPLVLDRLAPRPRTALRVVRMERLERLAELGASGVEVVTSEPPSSHDGVGVALAALTRSRRAG